MNGYLYLEKIEEARGILRDILTLLQIKKYKKSCLQNMLLRDKNLFKNRQLFNLRNNKIINK